MRIISHTENGRTQGGVALGEHVVELGSAVAHAGFAISDGEPLSVRVFLGRDYDRDAVLAAAVQLLEQGRARPLSELRLAPPVPDPDKILCIGLNYRDHAEEAGLALPSEPMVFAKFRNCLIGADDIPRPAEPASDAPTIRSRPSEPSSDSVCRTRACSPLIRTIRTQAPHLPRERGEQPLALRLVKAADPALHLDPADRYQRGDLRRTITRHRSQHLNDPRLLDESLLLRPGEHLGHRDGPGSDRGQQLTAGLARLGGLDHGHGPLLRSQREYRHGWLLAHRLSLATPCGRRGCRPPSWSTVKRCDSNPGSPYRSYSHAY
ncbi:hypothetical protein HD597_000332 [Nonomuraea thailandensis]|uniref:Fumarylacetoacetase-like C-terminal domain-containing protein n=1 Tax=Nonomuraea thailandensis TaxID=1188745 RepID=A0A9X2G667_9ACTN|nr:hypothetical protein [Nonomuraea thailandensis]